MAEFGQSSLYRRRRNARLIFILLLFISIALVFAWVGDRSVLSKIKSSTDDVMAPILSYVSMPIRGLEDAVSDLRARAKVHDENKKLKAELSRLSDIEARANALALKLSQLEDILQVDTASGIPLTRIAARAVTETNGPFVYSSLLNVGINKDVKVGYSVMTVDGLLGHIVRVGKGSSRVLRLEDLNSRVSVMSQRSKSRAILTGNNTKLPVLSFLSDDANWQKGDIVITSGDDGVLPAGLPIGYLAETEKLRVKLYIHDRPIDWVWIYPFTPYEAPEKDAISEPDLKVEIP